MYVIGTAGHVDHGKSALGIAHRALKYAASNREPPNSVGGDNISE